MMVTRLVGAGFAVSFAMIAQSAFGQNAPEWPDGAIRTVRARAGERMHVELRALDPRDGPVTYAATGTPATATFMAHPGRDGSASLDWYPSSSDVGVHEVRVTARGSGGDAVQTVRAVVEEDWAGYLLPGVQAASFFPNAADRWGSFFGGSIQFLVVTWIHRNDQPGPSHGRLHLDLDILKSTRADVSTALYVHGGVDLTLERNPSRRWLLPFTGIDAGVMFHKQAATTLVNVTPAGGLHLWAEPNFFVTASAGYVLPLSDRWFDELRGVRVKLGANLSFW